MGPHMLVWVVLGMVTMLLGRDATAQSHPEGQVVIAFDTSIVATYFHPAEVAGLQTPFVFRGLRRLTAGGTNELRRGVI
jgi:hypothetical protein